MSRKTTSRRVWKPVPPRGLRPHLDTGQVQDLSLVHHITLDAIATGTANEATLWQTLGGALTWSYVANKLGVGIEEMSQQIALLEQVVQRFERTGKVGFTGPEYQIAKLGVQVMDELAAVVDRPTAIEAAEWSERRCEQMVGPCDRRVAAC